MSPLPSFFSTIYTYTLGLLLAAFRDGAYSFFGFLNMVRWSSDIVKVVPGKPGLVDFARKNNVLGGERGAKGVTVNEWVEENVPSLKGTFTPAAWLPNGHLQTLFTAAGDFTKVDKVHYVRTHLRLPDGGTLGIDVTPKDHHLKLAPDAPTVVVCHGLTGGSHESYVRNILAWVIKPKSEGGLGGRGVVVNFRGCAGVPVTSDQLYSAGTTMDLALALHHISARHPSSKLLGIGFSLGASILARYLGEYGQDALVKSAVVLGCPWDLGAMSHKLENDWFTARVYSSTLGKNVLRLFFRAYDRNPAIFDDADSPLAGHMGELKKLRKEAGSRTRLRAVDDVLTCKIGGPRGIGAWPFESAAEYYAWASPSNVLSGVKVPLLAINAFDDPVVDGLALPLTGIQASTHIYTAITRAGGHLGWFDGPLFGSPAKTKHRWILQPVSEWLEACARDLRAPGEDARAAVGVGVEVEEVDGWEWVKEARYTIPGVERVGWKVLREGEVVAGEEDEGEGGLVQGL
ncbi:anon-23da protein [Cryptococcus wingfieldii CBS 7118]|uniref:Anon-23da protein n=1 Tax=Cryptococcus wingfieldii CBS 7118 TaxID=1295528 RepID=A0A1E3HRS7_9TREE|nr:anon-23da protein [Cryptococcus wingfieldii CBS 7118]ODN79060.1 anon-23da protein [Cryptococcus wingfieldii CBS 7118]